MAAIAPDDYMFKSDEVVFPEEISKRINALKGTIRESQQEGDEPFDDDVEECDALIAFRESVEHATGQPFDQATIVPDGNFPDWAREEAETRGDVSEDLAPFVDWERYSTLVQQDFKALDFGDDPVWVR